MRPPTPPDEADRLCALHELNILDTPPETDFDDVVALASQSCGTPVSLVTLIDADRQWFKARVGLDIRETSREISFCAHTILGKDLMVVPDLTADPRFAANPWVIGAPGVRFYAGAPLITRDGYALGSLCVVDTVPRRLTLAQLQALRALARQVTIQLDLRRYGELLAHDTEQLHRLEQCLDELGGLAKGLREPLSAVRRYLSAPGDQGVPEPVTSHAGPLANLVDHLLLLAAAPAAPRVRTVDLGFLTEFTVDAVRPIAEVKRIPVLCTASTEPTPVRAEPVRLQQALNHLLFSAVKYEPEGGRVEVDIDVEAGPTIRVWECDRTAGDRPSLFSHFYSAAVARPTGHGEPGCGLTVVKAIFDAHHATVTLYDQPGDGTVLHVAFPGVAPPPADTPPSASTPP
jgi:GAF domain-containing protein